MSFCINLSDPLVQQLNKMYSEVSVAKVIEFYNNSEDYNTKELTLELFDILYNKIVVKKGALNTKTLSEHYSAISSLEDLLTNDKEMLTDIKNILSSAFNWNEIAKSVNNIEAFKSAFFKLKDLNKEILTASDVQNIAEAAIMQLYNSAKYVDLLEKHVSLVLKDSKIEQREKISLMYHVKTISDYFNQSQTYLSSVLPESVKNIPQVTSALNSLIGVTKIINDSYINLMIDAISDELSDNLKNQTEKLIKNNLEHKKLLINLKNKLEEQLKVLSTKQGLKKRDSLKKQIEALDKQRLTYSTKENIKDALKKSFEEDLKSKESLFGNKNKVFIKKRIEVLETFLKERGQNIPIKQKEEVQKQINSLEQDLKNIDKEISLKDKITDALTSSFAKKDISVLTKSLESATLTNHILVGSIASYIDNTHLKASSNQQRILQKSEELFNRIAEEYGKPFLTTLQLEEMYEPYMQEVEVAYKDGDEIKYRKDIALVSEFNEVQYLNDKLIKQHEIEQLRKILSSASKEEYDILKEELLNKEIQYKIFIENNEDRGYTEEYHNIYNSFHIKARKAREQVISKMRLLDMYDKNDFLNDDILEESETLKFELARLESFVYEDGSPKEKDDLFIAQEIKKWKDANKDKKLFTYSFEKRKEEFKDKLKEKKELLKKAQENLTEVTKDFEDYKVSYVAVTKAAQERNKALKAYQDWTKTNVVRKISSYFYDEREKILSNMSDIQKKYRKEFEQNNTQYRTSEEIWNDIFSLTKGYKNEDGIYEAKNMEESAIKKLKELQEELEYIKNIFNKSKFVSEKDKEILKDSGEALRDLQTYQNTTKYEEAVEFVKKQIKAQYIAEKAIKDEDFSKNREIVFNLVYKNLLEKNPNKTKEEIEVLANQITNENIYLELAKENKSLNEEVEKRFKNSNWYKNNHYKTSVYDEILSRYAERETPLYVWREIIPNDDTYILTEEPSFKWSVMEVNSEYIRKDFKPVAGRVALRESSQEYRNTKYESLSDTKKSILKDIHDLYNEINKGLPSSLKRGTIIPSVQVSDFGSIASNIDPKSLKVRLQNIKDDILGLNDSADDELISGSKDNKFFLKFTRPMEADKKSKNLMSSIAMFGYDAERFKSLYSKSPYFHGMETIIKENFKGNNAGQMILNMFQKQLYGQNRKEFFENSSLRGALKTVNYFSDKSLKLSAKLMLAYKAAQGAKDFTASLINSLTQAHDYGISKRDLLRGMWKGSAFIKDLYLAEVNEGVESDYIKMLRYFDVVPARNGQGSNIGMSALGKAKSLAPGLKSISFVREFFSSEVKIGVFEALNKATTIKDKNGTLHNLLDAYEIKEGAVSIKDTFEESVVRYAEQMFFGTLQSANNLINGAQRSIDQADLKRYSLGRLAMFMKSWAPPQSVRRFAMRKRVVYGGGYEFEGAYTAVVQEIGNFLKDFMYNITNMSDYIDSIEKSRKNAIKIATYDSLAITVIYLTAMAIGQSLYGDDGEDEEEDTKYFWLYNLAYLADELETLHPVFGPLSIYHARVTERSDKHILTYYGEKIGLLPFQSVTNIYRELRDLTQSPAINLFDETIQRSAKGNILDPDRTPLNPALTGKQEWFAFFWKQVGMSANENWIMNPSYTYKTFDHYNSKWYIPSLEGDTKSLKKDIKELKDDINLLKEKIKTSDKEDIMYYQEKINRLNSQISEKRNQLGNLDNYQEDNLIN